MELQLILNDLSVAQPAADQFRARASMATLLSVMVRASQLGARRILRVPRGFQAFTLSAGYPIAAWQNDPDVEREQKQFFNATVSKLTYLDGLPRIEQQLTLVEYIYKGVQAHGLGVASALDGMAVSLKISEDWNESRLEIERRWVELDGNGELLSARETVYHASSPAHVNVHADWIRERIQSGVSEGSEIWQQRGELLPGLDFCRRVQAELERLGPTDIMLNPVLGRLKELDNYARRWTDGPFDATQLRKVTPESEGTINQHRGDLTFLCPDGQDRLFSWHARITPGPWRLHFCPDGTTRRIIIGRIGRKPFI